MADVVYYVEVGSLDDDSLEILDSVSTFDDAADFVATLLVRGIVGGGEHDAATILIGDLDGPHETAARIERADVAENAAAHEHDAELVVTIVAPHAVPADLRAVARQADPTVYVEYGPPRSGSRDMSLMYVQFDPELDDATLRAAELELNPGFSDRTLVISAMAQELSRHDVPAYAVARMAHDLADAVENLNDESLQAICSRNRVAPKELGTKIADGAMTTTAKRPSVLGTVDIPRATVEERGGALVWTFLYDGTSQTGSHPSPRRNPAGLTAKGERLYKHVLASINLKTDAAKKAAKRSAVQTVVSAARRGVPGLVRKNPEGNPPRVYRAQKVVAKLERDARPAIPSRGSVVTTPDVLVRDTLADYIGENATESYVAVFLNVRNQVIGFTEYNSGGIHSVEVHVSGIVRDALTSGAAAIITAHNHPSGDPTPSDDDRAIWRRLREAAAVVGIPVIDNLVVGEGGRFYSQAAEES